MSISKGLVNFYKFDNFRRFFRNNSSENVRSEISKDVKDAFQRDLDLSKQKFHCKMNSSAVIFEKPKKMRKIADFANFEPPWSLNANFAGHPVCGKMFGI